MTAASPPSSASRPGWPCSRSRCCGSEEQKQTWLPGMARLEKIGAFALTEPDHGSDSVALETTARRDGDSYVIDGRRSWIGNGTHRRRRGRVGPGHRRRPGQGVPRREGDPGLPRQEIEGKGSVRAVWQAEISLDGVRVPEANRLPGAQSFADTARVLAGDPQRLRMDGAGPRRGRVRRRARPTPSGGHSSASRWPASRSSSSGWSACSPTSRRCSSTACSRPARRAGAG